MQVLGRNAALDDACARLEAMTGVLRKGHPARVKGTEEEFFRILPEETRAAFRAHLAREMIPPIQPLNPLHISRVCGLAGPVRVMTALAVMAATANRRAPTTVAQVVKHGEVYSELLSGVDQRDDDKVAGAGSEAPRDRAGTARRASSRARS